MKLAMCHYSFHRTWAAQKWTADRLAEEVAKLGIEGIDYHTRFVGDLPDAAEQILAAVKKHKLTLSGLSFSNDFNQDGKDAFRRQVEQVKAWIQLAAKLKAPVSRIFGGALPRAARLEAKARGAAMQRVMDGLGEVVAEAEKHGVVLALENHGGLPATADEQIEAIRAIDSPSLKATIDVGNYMMVGEEGHVSTAKVVPYAAYVHFKDNKKVPTDETPWGWKVGAATLGDGAVDLAACYRALRDGGYDGYIAIEYEGTEDEATGVPRSVQAVRTAMAD